MRNLSSPAHERLLQPWDIASDQAKPIAFVVQRLPGFISSRPISGVSQKKKKKSHLEPFSVSLKKTPHHSHHQPGSCVRYAPCPPAVILRELLGFDHLP